tara:strand:+ start:3645 stop:4436 length:792 start_codon:yes stop_codon:yes gene_type:complete
MDIICYKNADKIITKKDFLENYENYINLDKNVELKLFLESIKKNKSYYKLNIDPLNKISNKKINIDLIKKFKNNINKLTENNKDIIFREILLLLEKEDFSSIMIDILIDSIILNNKYIDIYIELIKKINKDNDLNKKIDKFHNLLYKNTSDYDNKNLYNLLCEKNKCTDNSIGYSILVVKLEIYGLIENKINKLLLELIKQLNLDNDDDLYKYIQCIYNILKIKKIDEKYITDKLNDKLIYINKNIKNKKIKFKIMDINEVLV